MRKRAGQAAASHVEIKGTQVQILKRDAGVKYFGRMVTFHDPDDTELECRIASGWRCCRANKTVLCNLKLAIKMRIQLFDSAVTPVGLYGSGVWTMTESRVRKLRQAQRQMLRKLLQRGRQRLPLPEESTDSTGGPMPSQQTNDQDDLEPWYVWVQRWKHEAEAICADAQIQPWYHLGISVGPGTCPAASMADGLPL
jgi:hypothetical protein